MKDQVIPEHVPESAAECCINEAGRALDGAIAVLRAAGLFEPTRGVTVSLLFLLKLSACVRLYEWEEAGIIHRLDPPLPTSAEVWEDLVEVSPLGSERFPAKQLAARVFGAWLRQMAWKPPTARSDVIINALEPREIADELAEVLFKFRHLIDEH